MKQCNLLIACCLLAAALSAQTRKNWEAVYRSDYPELDGSLSESCWQALPAIGEFTTSTPVFGETPRCRTEVRLFYTEIALYIAARCYDPDAGGVRRDGGIRDGELTGDWFRVSIDTWNDDRLAFDFTVSAAGIQQDVRGGTGWDANWQSAVTHQADGWTLEMRIPFTALRYPRKEEQNWGIQFSRFDRSRGETSTWSPQDPLVQDRVLQFGTLSGVKNILQQNRHALAAHSTTSLQKTGPMYQERYFYGSFGLDARLGLNESATLDLTVAPPLGAFKKLANLSGFNDQTFWSTARLPEPRQLQAEENDLFVRGYGSLEPNPVVDPFRLLWRKPIDIGQFYTNPSESKLLNAVKFTGRTSGNWRVGVYHATLGPVKVDVGDFISSFNERETVTLQKLSAYNYLTAEYILPNNSYARISNASMLAGRDMNTFLPGVDFRLRNRANNLEISGNSLFTFQKTDTVGLQGYNYNLSLARINRRWGWMLTHGSRSEAFNPFLLDPNRLNFQGSASGAQINYRDFRPRGNWLNHSGRAGLSVLWAARPGEQNVWTLDAGFQALNKRFRQFSLGASLVPHYQVFRYEAGGAYLSQKVAPRVGILLGFASDARRRFSMRNNFEGRIHTEGKFPVIQDSFSVSWVLNRRFTLTTHLAAQGRLKELILLTTPGQWIFEQRSNWIGAGNLELNWYASRRLRVYGWVGLNVVRYKQRKALELQPDGQLTPVDYPLNEDISGFNDWEGELGFQYVISPLSQIRFRHRFSPGPIYYSTRPALSFPLYSNAVNFSGLDFIYTLGGGGNIR